MRATVMPAALMPAALLPAALLPAALAAVLCSAACGQALRGQSAPDGREKPDAAAHEEHLQRLIAALAASSAHDEPAVLAGIDLAAAPASVKAAARVLRETKVELRIEKESILKTLELLQAVSGLTFTLSARARKAAEAAGPCVTFAVTGLPLENALNLLALHLGDYRFVVRYGAIVLILKEEHKPPRILRVYNVSDIVRPRPDFPAPTLALDSGKEGGR